MATPSELVAAQPEQPAALASPSEPATPPRFDEPMRLWNKVVKPRSVVASARHTSVNRYSSTARAELLSALGAYAASLTNHKPPIPYSLRDELPMRRLTR